MRNASAVSSRRSDCSTASASKYGSAQDCGSLTTPSSEISVAIASVRMSSSVGSRTDHRRWPRIGKAIRGRTNDYDGSVLPDAEHDLAALPAFCDAGERRDGVLEREDRVDRGLELACVRAPGELDERGAVRLDDEVLDALALLRDRDHAGAGLGRSRERVAADRVEAERAWLARRRQLVARELNGEMADTATFTEHAYALARAEPPAVEQAFPCSEAGECQRRAFDVRQPLRLGCEHCRRRDGVLG